MIFYFSGPLLVCSTPLLIISDQFSLFAFHFSPIGLSYKSKLKYFKQKTINKNEISSSFIFVTTKNLNKIFDFKLILVSLFQFFKCSLSVLDEKKQYYDLVNSIINATSDYMSI